MYPQPPDLRRLPTDEIDRALTRMRSGDPHEIAYFAACRAICDGGEAEPLSPLAGPEDYAAEYQCALWASVDEAVKAAGYEPDSLDLYEDVAHAQENASAAMQLAVDGGGGSEDYRAARAFYGALDWTLPGDDRLADHPAPRQRGCHRRTPGTAAPRRRGSRRATSRSSGGGSSGDDDDGESEPPRLRLWRHPRFGSCTPNLLRILVVGVGL